jgi:hypothetical protein
MMNPDARLAALLAAERSQPDPPIDCEERVWTGVLGKLGPGGYGGGPDGNPTANGGPGANPVTAGAKQAAGGALAKAAIVAVLGVGAAAGVVAVEHASRAGNDESPPTFVQSDRGGEPELAVAPENQPEFELRPAEPPHGPSPSPASDANEGDDRSRAAAPPMTKARPRHEPTDPGAELELVAAIQSAQAGDRAHATLRLVNKHAQVFPHGQFREERQAARVWALCKLGRSNAMKAAAKFASEYPDSIHVDRLAAACEPRTSRLGMRTD